MFVDVLRVEVEVEDSDSPWGAEVVLFVNDRDLRDLCSHLGDGWICPPPEVLAKHPDHLRGGPDRWEDPTRPWYDAAAVLACGCGQPGCDAVLARIDYRTTEVIWSLHRRTGEPADVGPFHFDRREYESAIALVSPVDR